MGGPPQQYQQLLAGAAPAAETHHTTVSVSLDVTAARRAVRAEGGGIPGAAAVLRRQMATLTAAVRAAELTLTGWADPQALARMLRTAYDPAATHLDDTPSGPTRPPPGRCGSPNTPITWSPTPGCTPSTGSRNGPAPRCRPRSCPRCCSPPGYGAPSPWSPNR